jgi:hypothetical protein
MASVDSSWLARNHKHWSRQKAELPGAASIARWIAPTGAAEISVRGPIDALTQY